ncbi:hypothetical protein LXL04_035622 [Taraxacum kok-saghyz]
MTIDLWGLVARWWQVDIPVLSSMSKWTSRINGVRLRPGVRWCLETEGWDIGEYDRSKDV